MGEENKELFWEASIEEVKKGFIEEAEQYKCIICEESFTKGQIYPIDDKFFDAKKAVELHIEKQHGSTLAYLLGMNNGFTGVSGAQLELLKLMAAGLSDKEIAAKLEVAPSTIRNHRYIKRSIHKGKAPFFFPHLDTSVYFIHLFIFPVMFYIIYGLTTK